MTKVLLACSLALLGASGCAVTFYDSAPAAPGSRYVVGSKSNEAVVFLCPEKPKSGECELVDVTVND
jgi:hypothetical protein